MDIPSDYSVVLGGLAHLLTLEAKGVRGAKRDDVCSTNIVQIDRTELRRQTW